MISVLYSTPPVASPLGDDRRAKPSAQLTRAGFPLGLAGDAVAVGMGVGALTTIVFSLLCSGFPPGDGFGDGLGVANSSAKRGFGGGAGAHLEH